MTALQTVAFVIAMVLGFMLAEQRLSRANERRLRAAGAIEPAGDPWRAIAILYPGAFLLMGVEGAWRAMQPVVADAPHLAPSWAASGLLLFVASKALKYWAIGALGDRWSFRLLVEPGRPLVTSGPYRYVSHPNYIAVAGELVGTAMMMASFVAGPVMMGAFGVALWSRVTVEERALRGARSTNQPDAS